MKLLIAIFAAATLLSVPTARADEASKNAKAEEMMKVMNFDQMMDQVFDQMKPVMMAQLER